MAEGIFRHIMRGRRDIQVMSAGIGAMEGQAPSPYAVQAVRELGIDISRQRSRQLTADLVQEADYIFGMTHSHVDTVSLLYPYAAEKTFLLREFDDTLDIFEKDISDPIGGSYDVYVACRDQIEDKPRHEPLRLHTTPARVTQTNQRNVFQGMITMKRHFSTAVAAMFFVTAASLAAKAEQMSDKLYADYQDR